MSFVHDDPELIQLLRLVERESGIDAALIEKDYWITHSLWALHRSGLQLWFKGGTSLSKGFGLIDRFSEDLDLMVERGAVSVLPEVKSWTSTNKGPVAERHAFYRGLADAVAIPGITLELDETRLDKTGRTAEYIGHYPGLQMHRLPGALSPFVRFEVGRARVVPLVVVPLSSFVHDYLERKGMLGGYIDNRAHAVRCVHPLVTLLEKLDAVARRYGREVVEADGFVRHYEDAARIVLALDRLPTLATSTHVLVEDMLAQRDIAKIPTPDDPSLTLGDHVKRAAVEHAYARIAPMYWGPRISLDDATAIVRKWVHSLHE
jgi:hypothetical protein